MLASNRKRVFYEPFLRPFPLNPTPSMPSLKSLLLVALPCSCALYLAASAGEPAPPGDRDADLVRQLGAEKAEDRDHAEQAIWNRGKEILPLLEQAAQGDDPEVTERANSLIAKIKLALKPDLPTIQSEFADQYLKADEEKKGELMAEFMEREDLTADEARAAIRLQMQSITENGVAARPNDWQIEKLIPLLTRETTRLLNEHKISQAVELWSDIDFSPRIRHKYAALLYNSGHPFDESRFSPQDAALVKTELALLGGDLDEAKKQLPEGDSYTAQRIAAAELDLPALWRQELEDAANLSDCDQSLLPLVWAIARREGDQKTQRQIVDKLSKEDASLVDASMNFGLGDAGQLRAWYLLSCGEQQKAFDLVVKMTPENIAQSSNFSLSVPKHQDFSPVLWGAREDTLKEILSLAESLSPLDQDAPPIKKINQEEELKTFNQLINLANYLEERGEGAKMLPYIKAYIKRLPKEQGTYCLYYGINLFCQSNSSKLAFDLYRDASKENKLAEYRNYMEGMLTQCHEANLEALLKLAGEIRPDSKNREERMETLLKLTATIPVTEEERAELWSKTGEWIKQRQNEPETELVVSGLIQKMVFLYPFPKDILSLLDFYNKPVLPAAPLARVYFLTFITNYAPPEWQRRYLAHLTELQKKAPGQAVADKETDLFENIPSIAELGEYRAALHDALGQGNEAQKIRKWARMFSLSEKTSRQLEAITLTGCLPTPEILKKSLSSSFTEPEQMATNSANLYLNSFYGAPLLYRCIAEGLFDEASFLAENMIKESLLPQYGLPSMNLRGTAELVRGLGEWRNGKKDKAMESLSLARDLMNDDQNDLFYLSLIHYIPEKTETWKEWYETRRAQKSELLKKWPGFDKLRGSLIMSGLLLDSHFDESVNMIDEMSPLEPFRHFLSLIAQTIRAKKQGNFREARRILDEINRTYSKNGEPYRTLLLKELNKQESAAAAS